MTSAARWERLRSDLADAGVDAAVSGRAFAQTVYGRVEHGVTYSIDLRRADGQLIEISDQWGRMGKWYGWGVFMHDRQDIAHRLLRPTSRRSEVVAAVVAAVTEEAL